MGKKKGQNNKAKMVPGQWPWHCVKGPEKVVLIDRGSGEDFGLMGI